MTAGDPGGPDDLGAPRDPRPRPGGPEPSGPGPGSVRPSGPATVLVPALVGLVAGWALRPASLRLGLTPPTVGWSPVLALVLVAAIMAGAAWTTYRTLHVHRRRIAPHQAVNRLVLAKACILTGALVAGGYLGYALAWVGVSEADLGEQRLVRSLVAGLAGAATVAASLALERACRVRGDPSPPGTGPAPPN